MRWKVTAKDRIGGEVEFNYEGPYFSAVEAADAFSAQHGRRFEFLHAENVDPLPPPPIEVPSVAPAVIPASPTFVGLTQAPDEPEQGPGEIED